MILDDNSFFKKSLLISLPSIKSKAIDDLSLNLLLLIAMSVSKIS